MPPFLIQAFKEMTEILCEVKSPDDFEKAKTAIRALINNAYLKLRRKEYPLKDLAFNVTMSRPPGYYTKTTPQHVKAALLLVKKGQEVKSGDVISFIKSTDTLGVRPLQLADPKTVNIEKYVEYLESTFDQVLDALGIRFDDAVGTSKLESFLWGK
jgi:DNA polymerase I